MSAIAWLLGSLSGRIYGVLTIDRYHEAGLPVHAIPGSKAPSAVAGRIARNGGGWDLRPFNSPLPKCDFKG
jgi:hypothetical protein